MAKGNKHDGLDNNASRPSGTTWCNINLSDDDVQQIINWQPESDDILIGIINLTLSGYSFTLKPDPHSKGFLAFAFSSPAGDGSGNMGLSGFASTPRDAVKVLLFKLDVKLGGDLSAVPLSHQSSFR